jgi:hypothetical protein
MKSIKKIVAVSTLAIILFGFGFNPEPVEARGLTCLLFGCQKAEHKDPRETDPLYGDPPNYDSIYGKVPPTAEDYNPNSPNPYGWYGNTLERIMGRDIRELIELDKRTNKRPPASWLADRTTVVRAILILPRGKLKKTIPLADGNTAYMFQGYFDTGGSGGTPDKKESRTISVPFDKYSYGVQTVYESVPGTPGTPGTSTDCTTYVVANRYGKLFYWSYEGNSNDINGCSSDKRRLG